MKKTLLSLALLTSFTFANELEKQIPQLFNKMLDNFEKQQSLQDKETANNIINSYKNGNLLFCETRFQRSIVSKKKSWILDEENKLFINTQKENFFYLHECKVFKSSNKIYL